MTPNIVIIYDSYSTHTSSVKKHIESISLISEGVFYFLEKEKLNKSDLKSFHAVIIHYSCRLAFPQTLPANFNQILSQYTGRKYIFIQDEYDNTENTRAALEKISPDIVFTCVPDRYRDLIYPRARFPKIKFVQVLTGYAPSTDYFKNFGIPYRERSIDIGYRGRILGYRYGRLGYDKWQIGELVSKSPEFNKLNLDISSNDKDRIYGDDWFRFLANCKAVLGTESGSNVFDFDGNLAKIESSFRSFQEFQEKYIVQNPEFDFMGQISPRIFESASMKVLNILYPGSYSGIIKPWIHYLPLNRDLSNAHEILDVLKNEAQVQHIVQNAYADLIESGKYSQEAFSSHLSRIIIPDLDAEIKEKKIEIFFDTKSVTNHIIVNLNLIQYLSVPPTLKKIWRSIPFAVRIKLYAYINKTFNYIIKRSST